MLVDSLTQSQSHTDKTQPPPEPETVSRNPTQSLPVARGWREADSFPASVSFPGVCMWGPSTAIATAAAVFHAVVQGCCQLLQPVMQALCSQGPPPTECHECSRLHICAQTHRKRRAWSRTRTQCRRCRSIPWATARACIPGAQPSAQDLASARAGPLTR